MQLDEPGPVRCLLIEAATTDVSMADFHGNVGAGS